MFLHTFRKISLHVFTLFTSQDGNYFQNFCKKFFARIRPTMQFVEHLPIFDKQNAIAIAGRKSVIQIREKIRSSRYSDNFIRNTLNHVSFPDSPADRFRSVLSVTERC